MTDTHRPKDRRLHPRVPLAGQLSFGPRHGSALLKDVSMSGVACHSSVDLPEMTMLELTTDLPLPGGPRPFRAGGAVVRCEALAGGGFLVAIFFTHMDDEARATLGKYIGALRPAGTGA